MSLSRPRSASPESRTISAWRRCSRVELRAEEQVGHAENAVHGGADLVAHDGEELGLGARGRLGGGLGGPGARALILGARPLQVQLRRDAVERLDDLTQLVAAVDRQRRGEVAGAHPPRDVVERPHCPAHRHVERRPEIGDDAERGNQQANQESPVGRQRADARGEQTVEGARGRVQMREDSSFRRGVALEGRGRRRRRARGPGRRVRLYRPEAAPDRRPLARDEVSVASNPDRSPGLARNATA